MNSELSQAIFGISSRDEIPSELANQLEKIDLNLISELAVGEQKSTNWSELAAKAKPPTAFRADAATNSIPKSKAIEAGEALLRAGKTAMILVAGGQGTRLGFDKPKGMFEIGPLSNRTLFEIIIDHLKAIGAKYDTTIPLYVMTSPATHAETVQYFAEHEDFGLAAGQLAIFCQGTMPAVDMETGKLLRASENSLALSPNGHGGMLDALIESGCFAAAKESGVEHFFYGQIDNPLVQVCDPELLGYHLLSNSELTTQVVQKADALERVGNVVEINGQVQIIEYSDLPEEFALKTNDDESLYLWAGNIAVHVFATSFLEKAAASSSALPFHLAKKKVPFIDSNGSLIEPSEPNALKFEKFIFDLLPLAENAIAVEVKKSAGFAPVKNANGAASDTPELAMKAISDLHRGWLEENGVNVGGDVNVEIHPSFAVSSKDLKGKDLPDEIVEDSYLK